MRKERLRQMSEWGCVDEREREKCNDAEDRNSENFAEEKKYFGAYFTWLSLAERRVWYSIRTKNGNHAASTGSEFRLSSSERCAGKFFFPFLNWNCKTVRSGCARTDTISSLSLCALVLRARNEKSSSRWFQKKFIPQHFFLCTQDVTSVCVRVCVWDGERFFS